MSATWINPNDPFSQRAAILAEREDEQRRWDGQAWSLALKGAREWRREAVATSLRRGRASIESQARDCGLVPHPESTITAPHGCLSCPRAQRIQRDAAAVIDWERHHPWSSPDRVFHLTAWATAR